MADVTELRMNVTALKRVDPYAKDIIETARHVAFYSFNSEENEWERTNVEGALFIYSRNGEPYHGILIINRLNTNNLVEPVVSGLDLQLQEPFLLYRNSNNNIRGFWFYDKDECVKVARLLERIVKDIQTQPPQETVPQNPPQNHGTSVDIFTMLSKAQEDFNSHNQPAVSKFNQQVPPQAPPKPDVTSQSVMDFFAKATNTQGTAHFAAPMVVAAEPHHSEKHLMQRLMSNPAHSVEHIEKQQRSVTPLDTTFNTEPERIPYSVQQRPEMNHVPLSQPPGLPIEHAPVMIENGISFMRISSPHHNQSPLNMLYTNKVSKSLSEVECRPLSAPLCSADTPQKPALMPPTMFTSSASKEPPNRTPLLEKGDIIITPEPLTRNQLLQAVGYLLRTDIDFVNKLHEAYLKSFNDIIH